jgi:hypothetical protein
MNLIPTLLREKKINYTVTIHQLITSNDIFNLLTRSLLIHSLYNISHEKKRIIIFLPIQNNQTQWKKTIKTNKIQRIRAIDDDIHLNHNDNVIHDFLPYRPK